MGAWGTHPPRIEESGMGWGVGGVLSQVILPPLRRKDSVFWGGGGLGGGG